MSYYRCWSYNVCRNCATTGQGSVKSLVSNTPPIGKQMTDHQHQTGALYYNVDFRTIEYWDDIWRQVDNTTKRGRGLVGGGSDGNTALINQWKCQLRKCTTLVIELY